MKWSDDHDSRDTRSICNCNCCLRGGGRNHVSLRSTIFRTSVWFQLNVLRMEM